MPRDCVSQALVAINTGYNSSNDFHDKFLLINGSLDQSHGQHEGCDQDHHPPGITQWFVDG